MQIQLVSYNSFEPVDEYEFVARDDDGVEHAKLWATVYPDTTDITIELTHPEIPNTAGERAEFMLVHSAEIHRAIKSALED